MEEHGFVHKSVLLYETVGSLNIKPGGIYVDGTLGRAGHSREIAKRLTTGRLIAIDRDQAALDALSAQFPRLAPRLEELAREEQRAACRILLQRADWDGADLAFTLCRL